MQRATAAQRRRYRHVVYLREPRRAERVRDLRPDRRRPHRAQQLELVVQRSRRRSHPQRPHELRGQGRRRGLRPRLRARRRSPHGRDHRELLRCVRYVQRLDRATDARLQPHLHLRPEDVHKRLDTLLPDHRPRPGQGREGDQLRADGGGLLSDDACFWRRARQSRRARNRPVRIYWGALRRHENSHRETPPLEGDTSTGGTLAILGVMRTGHSRGVSVLEIILVVAVLGIMLAVGFPRLVTPAARMYANDVKAQLEQARYEAIKRNAPVAVVYDWRSTVPSHTKA